MEAEESGEREKVQIFSPALAWIEARPVPIACAEQSSTQRPVYNVHIKSQGGKMTSKKLISRREFLRLGALTAAGAAMVLSNVEELDFQAIAQWT